MLIILNSSDLGMTRPIISWQSITRDTPSPGGGSVVDRGLTMLGTMGRESWCGLPRVLGGSSAGVSDPREGGSIA